jgi:hypothetical protein
MFAPAPHHGKVRAPSHAVVTTALDVLGLLLLAAGACAALWILIGPAALALAGGVVLIGSALSERAAKPAEPEVR